MTAKTLPLAERPVFVCEHCWKPVRSDDGYLCVDVAAASIIRRDGGRINWRVCHADCDDAAKATDHRVWIRQFASMIDLVETLCALADQKRWFAVTNWSGLVRRVLRDTERRAEDRKNNARTRMQRMLNDPNDEMHGTEYGYEKCKCRCDQCKAANAEKSARQRAKRNGHNGVNQFADSASESIEGNER